MPARGLRGEAAGGARRRSGRRSFFTADLQRAARPRRRLVRRARAGRREATPLPDYLERVGRPVPADDPDAGPMAGSISLVSAVKS